MKKPRNWIELGVAAAAFGVSRAWPAALETD
jgi:hypothetical protein